MKEEMKMKKFNGYAMTGVTVADNKAIMEAETDLFIDHSGRVWTEGGIYIADAVEVEPGCGIYC